MPLLDGGETTLRDLISNGPALLAFFKVSCPVCQMTLPFLDRIEALLDSEEAGFVVSNAFGISRVPTFLVETDGWIGRLIAGWTRLCSWSQGRLRHR
jgi:hypothetical protein